MEYHTGKRPVIYTDINFHRDVLEGEFNGYEFWLRSVAAEPHERFGNRPWTFWQYTATGRVPGIRGDVDRNAFHGSRRRLGALAEEPRRRQLSRLRLARRWRGRDMTADACPSASDRSSRDDEDAWLPLWRGYLDFYETSVSDEVTDATWRRIVDPAGRSTVSARSMRRDASSGSCTTSFTR